MWNDRQTNQESFGGPHMNLCTFSGREKPMRSARLIKGAIEKVKTQYRDMQGLTAGNKEKWHVDGGNDALGCIHIDLQPGDEMTGWEIIASLPIEAQNIECIAGMPKKLKVAYDENMKYRVYTIPAILYSLFSALRAVYVWNGEAWEVVE
jgi:hypothetical protein